MKKTLLLGIGLCASLSMMADITTVKNVYSGPAHNVTWENTLTIPAEQFADGVNVGDYIRVDLSNATDVLELKADGTWLPGTLFRMIQDATEYKAYITKDMLSTLKQHGLEICGASFTVNSVDIMNDGFQMPEGAIWGGYFWIENWNTLELWKTAFDSYTDQDTLEVYLSEDNGDFSGYFMKVMTSWNEADIWANNDQIEKTPTKATISLKDINVKQALESTDRLMVQSNPEGGAPFNITALVLTGGFNTGISSPSDFEAAPSDGVVYNLQGVALRKGVSEDEIQNLLPAGLYIINGKKVAVR